MRQKISHPSMVSEPSLSLKHIPRKGLASHQPNQASHQNINSPSILNSYDRNNYISENQNISKVDDLDSLPMEYFVSRYMFGEQGEDKLVEEMEMIVKRKRNEVESLRIYRDQLRFISKSNSYNEPLKISLQILKQKASIQQKLSEYKQVLLAELKTTEKDIHYLEEYEKYMLNVLQDPFTKNNDILDIEKQEQVMIRNLQNQTEMFLKQLIEEQKRNSREVKQIQQQILDYRVSIKQKQDNLRNLKAKICTLYIKLHSRNNSRSGSKSKNRNLSLSVKKFNYQNHSSVKQVFVGNSTFKSYSREIIEKVTAEDDLVKIRFIICSGQNENQNSKENTNNKGKQNMFFQCIYRKKQGQLHDNRAEVSSHDIDATRDKLSQASEKTEQIYTKYLLSMKFYYKSKIVGVECRVKTDKGNKHIQIGNCSSNLEHQLLTLVNKKIITMASFWHGKDMIGISVWYSEKPKEVTNGKKEGRTEKERKQKQVYEQYYF